MYSINQILILTASGTSITITHLGEQIKSNIPTYLLKETNYADKDKIELKDTILFSQNVIAEYVSAKLHLLKGISLRSYFGENITQHCNTYLEYSSVIRLCQHLDDRELLYELINQLFLIKDNSLFKKALSLFTTKQLWKEAIINRCDKLKLTDENDVEYISKLYSDSKYYKKYMFTFFDLIDRKSMIVVHTIKKRFWDDLSDYIELTPSSDDE